MINLNRQSHCGSYFFDAFESRRRTYIGLESGGEGLLSGEQPSDLKLSVLTADPLVMLTTAYIGDYFEWTSSTSTMVKYYYAADIRVAMRVGSSTLYYLFGDHLGSTAITANSSGTRVAELMYKPWGENRFTFGTTPTTFRFTGQRQQNLLGLYYYGARWYDPALSRFIQADSLVSDPYNPQAWDRFAYVLNNPLRYTDPTGHLVCSDPHVAEGDCSDEGAGLWRYNISLMGRWSIENRPIAREAAYALGSQLAGEFGGTPWDAFKETYDGNVNFTWGLEGAKGECATITAGGCTSSPHQINFMSLAHGGGYKTAEMAAIEARNTVVHELAHAFGQLWYREDGTYDPEGPYVNIPAGMLDNDGFYPSPASASLTWRQHPCMAGDYGCANEVFADMALGWTFDMWASDRYGEERNFFMITNMAEWVPATAGR